MGAYVTSTPWRRWPKQTHKLAMRSPSQPARPSRRSRIARIIRTLVWAILIAFAVGLVIGTWLRRELEEPERYIGDQTRSVLLLTIRPGHVGHAQTDVLVACHHEEKVRQAIQVAQGRGLDRLSLEPSEANDPSLCPPADGSCQMKRGRG